MGDLGNGLDVRHVVPGVADALDVHGLGLGVDGLLQILGLVALDGRTQRVEIALQRNHLSDTAALSPGERIVLP